MTYDLNESLDIDFAPAWIANEFDKLIGVVVDKSSRTTDDGTYPILTFKITETPKPVRLKEGEAKAGDVVAWHAMGTIAMNAVLDVSIGDTVAVKRKADYAHKTRKDRKDPSKPLMMRDWKVIVVPSQRDSARTSASASDVADDGPSADELI